MPQRQIFQSETKAWPTTGGTIQIPLQFLDPTRDWSAPVIQDQLVLVNLNITNAATHTRAELAAHIAQMVVNDAAGERCNLSGPSLRVLDHAEYGLSHFSDLPTVPISAGVNFQFAFRIPWRPQKARKSQDFGLACRELLSGGKIEIHAQSVAGITVNSGTVQVFADVIEDRKPKLLSRLCFLEYAVTLQEDNYPVNGLLRSLIYYAGDTGEAAGTKLAAQNFSSKSLDYLTIPASVFVERYREQNFVVSADVFADVASGTTGTPQFAIELLGPTRTQKIPQMPNLATVHVKSDTAIPAGDPKMIITSITDRSPSNSLRILAPLGIKSTAQMDNVLSKAGVVPAANGKRVGVNGWRRDLAMKMPVTIASQALKKSA